jgi:hypothetical protein
VLASASPTSIPLLETVMPSPAVEKSLIVTRGKLMFCKTNIFFLFQIADGEFTESTNEFE